MFAHYTFIPPYCPSCGIPTRLERADKAMSGTFKARQALTLAIYGVMYQLADRTKLLRAATASGGEMIEYFVDEDETPGPRNGNQ